MDRFVALSLPKGLNPPLTPLIASENKLAEHILDSSTLLRMTDSKVTRPPRLKGLPPPLPSFRRRPESRERPTRRPTLIQQGLLDGERQPRLARRSGPLPSFRRKPESRERQPRLTRHPSSPTVIPATAGIQTTTHTPANSPTARLPGFRTLWPCGIAATEPLPNRLRKSRDTRWLCQSPTRLYPSPQRCRCWISASAVQWWSCPYRRRCRTFRCL